jgi:hypothetical protein
MSSYCKVNDSDGGILTLALTGKMNCSSWFWF